MKYLFSLLQLTVCASVNAQFTDCTAHRGFLTRSTDSSIIYQHRALRQIDEIGIKNGTNTPVSVNYNGTEMFYSTYSFATGDKYLNLATRPTCNDSWNIPNGRDWAKANFDQTSAIFSPGYYTYFSEDGLRLYTVDEDLSGIGQIYIYERTAVNQKYTSLKKIPFYATVQQFIGSICFSPDGNELFMYQQTTANCRYYFYGKLSNGAYRLFNQMSVDTSVSLLPGYISYKHRIGLFNAVGRGQNQMLTTDLPVNGQLSSKYFLPRGVAQDTSFGSPVIYTRPDGQIGVIGSLLNVSGSYVPMYEATLANLTTATAVQAPKRSRLLAYPNPSGGRVCFSKTGMGPGQLVVLDATGLIKYQDTWSQEADYCQELRLASGLYLARLTSQSGQNQEVKFVLE